MEQAVIGNSRNKNLPTDLEEENSQLWAKVNEMELKLKKKMAGKKAMKKAHLQELRSRDRREFVFLSIVGSCFLLYCLCALMIRGFV